MRFTPNQTSKVFQGYNVSIGIDRDNQHSKVWSQKYEQAKHVQQMKQMDKIFQSIIKERIFGNIITEKAKLSNQEYLKLNKINKTTGNSFYTSNNLNTIRQRMNRTLYNSPVRKLKNYENGSNSRQNRRSTLEPLNSFNSTIYPMKNTLDKINTKYYNFDNLNNNEVNNFTEFSRHLTINYGEKSPGFSLKSGKNSQDNEKYINLFRSKTDVKGVPKVSKKLNSKQFAHTPRPMNLEGLENFEEHFKNLSLTPTIFLYDIKITKELLISKMNKNIDNRLIEYFLYFFGFPSVISFRQYKKGIEKAFNSSVNLIYFFTFRVLDESGNGFLTISDLFRFFQKYQDTTYLEKQIFAIKEKIHQISKNLLQKSKQQRQIKPSLEQILLVNHKLKADQVSQLLKQSVKQEINSSGQTKLTCYSQSILALEHDVNVRLKHSQLQAQKNQSQALNNKNTNDKKQELFVQDGLRLIDFGKIFNGKRPKLFCVLVNLLTGLKNQDYQ